MITDFYIADKSEAGAIAADPTVASPALSTNNADNSVLADLWSALDRNANAAALQGDDYLVCSFDGGPWVFELPEGLVTGLARMSDDEAGPVCNAWAIGPEMQHFNVSEADLLNPLAELRHVALRATEAGKSLLLLMSV